MRSQADDRANEAEHRRPARGPRAAAAASGGTRSRNILRQRNAVVGLILARLPALRRALRRRDRDLRPGPGPASASSRASRSRRPPCIHLLGCPATSRQHIMGIDGNVRDEFSRVVHGARISLFVGFMTVGFAILIGDARRPRRRLRRRLDRQRPHADHGRPAGVPCPAPGDRDRHRARREPDQRPARDRHRGDPDLCPDHARLGAVGPRERLRDGLAGARRERPRPALPADPAERADAADRRRDARHRRAPCWTWRPCRSSASAPSRRWPSGAR